MSHCRLRFHGGVVAHAFVVLFLVWAIEETVARYAGLRRFKAVLFHRRDSDFPRQSSFVVGVALCVAIVQLLVDKGVAP